MTILPMVLGLRFITHRVLSIQHMVVGRWKIILVLTIQPMAIILYAPIRPARGILLWVRILYIPIPRAIIISQ